MPSTVGVKSMAALFEAKSAPSSTNSSIHTSRRGLPSENHTPNSSQNVAGNDGSQPGPASISNSCNRKSGLAQLRANFDRQLTNPTADSSGSGQDKNITRGPSRVARLKSIFDN